MVRTTGYPEREILVAIKDTHRSHFQPDWNSFISHGHEQIFIRIIVDMPISACENRPNISELSGDLSR